MEGDTGKHAVKMALKLLSVGIMDGLKGWGCEIEGHGICLDTREQREPLVRKDFLKLENITVAIFK